MRDAVREERPFTDAMRDRFYAQLVQHVATLRLAQADLAVAQATFKERHRALVAAAFPDVVFVLVEAGEDVRLARLARGNPVTVAYARQIAAYFEPPAHAHFVIRNEGRRAAVVAQLRWLLAALGAGDW